MPAASSTPSTVNLRDRRTIDTTGFYGGGRQTETLPNRLPRKPSAIIVLGL
jgi:hypothetical protein